MTDLFERFVESGQAAHAAVDQVLAGPKFIAGVDPGLDGAIVLLPGDANLSPIKFVMPTIEVKIKTGPKKGKSKRLYDLTDIRGFGQLEGLCAGIPISYELVHPRSWQPKMLPAGQGDTKARAVLAAKRLFPSFDLRAHDGCRVPHKGIPDALLIAEFGRRRLGGDIAPEDELLGF
jgi:hypothetical protein